MHFLNQSAGRSPVNGRSSFCVRCTFCVTKNRYRGVYFGLYDTGSAKNPWKADKGAAGMASKFAIAQATAITAGYASYPFDTVRRRLQMQSEKPKADWQYQVRNTCRFRSCR